MKPNIFLTVLLGISVAVLILQRIRPEVFPSQPHSSGYAERARPYELKELDETWCEGMAPGKPGQTPEMWLSSAAGIGEPSKKITSIQPKEIHTKCLDAYYFDQLPTDNAPKTVLVTKKSVIVGMDEGGIVLADPALKHWSMIAPPLSNLEGEYAGDVWSDNARVFVALPQIYEFSEETKHFLPAQTSSMDYLNIYCPKTTDNIGDLPSNREHLAIKQSTPPLHVRPVGSFQRFTVADSFAPLCEGFRSKMPQADLSHSNYQPALTGDELWFPMLGDWDTQGDKTGGLVQYNYKTGQVQVYRKEDGLASNRCCAVAADEKEVFVAHCGKRVKSLSVLDKKSGKWSQISRSENRLPLDGHKLLLDGPYLWIGSMYGLVRYDRSLKTAFELGEQQGAIQTYVNSLTRSEDALWVTYHYTNPIGVSLRRPIPLVRIKR